VQGVSDRTSCNERQNRPTGRRAGYPMVEWDEDGIMDYLCEHAAMQRAASRFQTSRPGGYNACARGSLGRRALVEFIVRRGTET
jgi:hypothetical protein